MNILDLTIDKLYNNTKSNFFHKSNYYLILCTPEELKELKDPLEIDETTFGECLEFDDSMKLDVFDKYDFISLNTYKLENKNLYLEEINMYLADRFILVVVNNDNFLYKYINDVIENKHTLSKTPIVSLYKINYLIFKKIMLNGFENEFIFTFGILLNTTAFLEIPSSQSKDILFSSTSLITVFPLLLSKKIQSLTPIKPQIFFIKAPSFLLKLTTITHALLCTLSLLISFILVNVISITPYIYIH